MRAARLASIAFPVLLFLWSAPGNAAPSQKQLEITPENAKVLEHLADYPDLEVLSIRCLEDLKALPDSIGKLANLRELIIDNGNECAMNPALPESIGNLSSLEKLVLYGGQDPRRFGALPLKRQKFPQSMSRLTSLTYLDLGRNGLEEIPAFVKDLPRLRELHFGWNMKLRRIPSFLANLRELTTLDLQSDGLSDLPDFLGTLPALKHISLGDNHKITASPAKMRDLKRRFPKLVFDFNDEYD